MSLPRWRKMPRAIQRAGPGGAVGVGGEDGGRGPGVTVGGGGVEDLLVGVFFADAAGGPDGPEEAVVVGEVGVEVEGGLAGRPRKMVEWRAGARGRLAGSARRVGSARRRAGSGWAAGGRGENEGEEESGDAAHGD